MHPLTAARTWVTLFRLPVVLAVMYVNRQRVLDFVEAYFGLGGITATAIGILSTPITRLAHFTGAAVMLIVVTWATARLRPATGYLVAVTTAFAGFATSVALLSSGQAAGWVAVVIVATNLAPDSIVMRDAKDPRVGNRLMALAVGVAEVFCFRRYLAWATAGMTGRSRFRNLARRPIAPVMPGLLAASLVLTLGLDGSVLTAAEQRLRSRPETTILARGDFNWIELDSTRQHLYVTGPGLERLRRYDLSDLSGVPLESAAPTGKAQAFAYDAQATELYVYEAASERLLYFDAATLALKRAVPLPGMAGGDVWLAVDGTTDSIAIASERDTPGVPFAVVNRTTGRVVDQIDLDSGNLLKHPAKPYVYLSSFRRENDLKVYDLGTRQVRHRTPADRRSHRMAYWPAPGEVLLAASIEGRVQRFDAETLAPKGHFDAPFGVRAVALDEGRHVMLCASSTGGHVSLIDLDSGRTTASYYLGPWLRSIALDVANGTAYVSSRGALYRLQYDRDRRLGRLGSPPG